MIRYVLQSAENLPKKQNHYDTFPDVVNFVKKITFKESNLQVFDDRVTFERFKNSCSIPYLSVTIDDILGFAISVFGWLLPSIYYIYKENLRTVRHITISSLLSTCDNLLLCPGIQGYEGQFVSKKIDPLFRDNDDDVYCTSPFSQEEFRRHIDCQLLATDNPCAKCHTLEVESTKLTNRKKKRFLTPAKPNAPVSKTTPGRLKLTLQEQRLKCTLL